MLWFYLVVSALAFSLSGCGVKDDPVPYLDVVRARSEKAAKEAKESSAAPAETKAEKAP